MAVLGGIFHVDSMVAGGFSPAAPRGAKLVSEDPIILASSYVARGYFTYREIDTRRVSPVSVPVSWNYVATHSGQSGNASIYTPAAPTPHDSMGLQ